MVRFRRGLDGNALPPLRIPGEQSRDREMLIAKLAAIMADERPGFRVAMMFVDSAFESPYVERLHVLGYRNVVEVNFGSPAPDRHQANVRAYIWNLAKEWLPRGAIDPADEKLAMDLAGPGAKIREKTGQLVLESKAEMQKRGLASPDDGDAFCLTFACPVAPQEKEQAPPEDEFGGGRYGNYGGGRDGWMR